MAGGLRPHRQTPPNHSIEQRCGQQQRTGRCGKLSIHQAPSRQHQKRQCCRAGCGEYDAQHHDGQQRALYDQGYSRLRHALPAQGQHRHHGPQQQTAQVIGLPKVAGGPALKPTDGQPLSVCQLRRKDLQHRDQRCPQPRDQQGDGQQAKRPHTSGLGPVGGCLVACEDCASPQHSAGCEHHQKSRQRQTQRQALPQPSDQSRQGQERQRGHQRPEAWLVVLR